MVPTLTADGWLGVGMTPWGTTTTTTATATAAPTGSVPGVTGALAHAHAHARGLQGLAVAVHSVPMLSSKLSEVVDVLNRKASAREVRQLAREMAEVREAVAVHTQVLGHTQVRGGAFHSILHASVSTRTNTRTNTPY